MSVLTLSPKAAAETSEVYVNVVDLDIKAGQVEKFIAFAKQNGADAVKEQGRQEHKIVVSKTHPNHIMLFEVYDNEAALNAHKATDHFKTFLAATGDLVAIRSRKAMSVVALNSKNRALRGAFREARYATGRHDLAPSPD